MEGRGAGEEGSAGGQTPPSVPQRGLPEVHWVQILGVGGGDPAERFGVRAGSALPDRAGPLGRGHSAASGPGRRGPALPAFLPRSPCRGPAASGDESLPSASVSPAHSVCPAPPGLGLEMKEQVPTFVGPVVQEWGAPAALGVSGLRVRI